MRSVILVLALTTLTTTAAFAQKVKSGSFEIFREGVIHAGELFNHPETKEAGQEFYKSIVDAYETAKSKGVPDSIREILIAKEEWKVDRGLNRLDEAKHRAEVSGMHQKLVSALNDAAHDGRFKKHPAQFKKEMTASRMNLAIMNRAREIQFAENGRRTDPSPQNVLLATEQIVETFAVAYASNRAPSLIWEYRNTRIPDEMESVARLMGRHDSFFYQESLNKNLGGINAVVATSKETSQSGQSQH